MRAEWKQAVAFAEVAEALGVNTTDILAYGPDMLVLFSPESDQKDPEIYSAVISRDADNILRPGPWKKAGTFSALIADMEERARQLGESSRD